MLRLQRDDQSALDELLKRHWQRLTAYAEKILGARDSAEDVVQAVFIRAWNHRARWTGSGSVRAYLYRIARNLALDERKSRRVRAAWLRPGAAPDQTAARAADAAVEDNELATAMTRAIDALPERRREVFVLARLHDLSYQQVADVMGISRQTVANQMGAALADLRHALEPFYEGARRQANRGRP